MIRRRFVFAGMLAALFALGWWVGRGGASASLYSGVDLFVEVLHKIEDNYVDPIEPSRMIEGALKGMLGDLDPYSQYLDTKSLSNLQAVTEGKFSGIGVVVGIREGFPTVISPIEGSPAWEAGVHSGDVIVRIEGQSSAGFSVEEAAARLRGQAGTAVKIAIRSEGSDQEREVALTRREIETHSVPYAFVVPEQIGYLRLANFSEKSGEEVKETLGRLRAAGARRLILDLRSNPGGLLDQAVSVAEQFLPQGTLVVYTRGRIRNSNHRHYATATAAETGWPMVVLVDRGSASAAEIVAGALQDRDRALVIGATSYGKGSVQSVYPLKGKNAALKLTTALYYTPSGRSIHRRMSDSVATDAEEEGLEPPPAPAAPDSAERPRFMTAGGRNVFGGGGITPDLPLAPDTLPPLVAKIEQRGLAFRFANRWVNTHPGRLVTPLGAEGWKAFAAFLRTEKLEFEEAELQGARVSLERAVARELARRNSGDSAAVRIALAADPGFREAVRVLSGSRRAQDVFGLAAVAPPTAPPSAERARPSAAPRRGANRPRPAPDRR